MSAGRNILNDFLQGKPQDRPVLLPFINCLLARFAGKPYEDILASPGDWTAALLKSMDLLQTDGIIAGYDDATLAQAMHAARVGDTLAAGFQAAAGTLADEVLSNHGVAVAVETVQRLTALAGRTYACAAGMVGPGKLSGQLPHSGDIEAGIRAIKKPYMAVAEAYLKTRPDALLLFEQLGGTGGMVPAAVARLYATLRNQAAYYNVPLAVYFEGYHPDHMDQLSGLRHDITILGRNIHGDEPGMALLLQFTDKPAGIGINLEEPEQAAGVVRAAYSACRDRRNLLLTGLSPPAVSIDLNSLRSVFRNLAATEVTGGHASC